MEEGSFIEELINMRICRICLSGDAELHWVFDNYVKDDEMISYDQILFYVSYIEITEDDTLPKSICLTCLQKLVSAFELIQQVEQSDSVLKSCTKSLQNADSKKDDSEEDNSIVIIIPEYHSNTKNEEETQNVISDNLLNGDRSHFESSESLKQEVDDISETKATLLLDIQELNKTTDESIDFLPDSSSLYIPSTSKPQAVIRHRYRSLESAKSKDLKWLDYNCTMCSQTFDNWHQLKLHRKTHPKGSRHYCRICNRSYGRASIMKRHFFTHNGIKDHKCKLCGKEFFYLHALRSHINYHMKNYECNVCQKRFSQKWNLTEHITLFHPDIPSQEIYSILDSINDIEDPKHDTENKNTQYDCSMCTETFVSFKQLQAHRTIHPHGSRHRCKACGNTYSSLASLQRHLVTHSGAKPYLCPICGKNYSLENSLKSHMLYHTEKTLKCDICQKSFHTPYDMKEHTRVAHSENRYKFICETCGKPCTSNGQLSVHQESHCLLFCPHCGKCYRTLQNLKMHIEKHGNELSLKKTYICDYCGLNRHRKLSLERHILKKHMRERNFHCDTCGKGFYDRMGLIQHGAVHFPQLEQCEVCGRRLTTKRALMNHKRLHSGESFKCNACDSIFFSKESLVTHQNKNHGVDRYSCKMCSEKFYVATELYKHMSIHTKCIKIQTALTDKDNQFNQL